MNDSIRFLFCFFFILILMTTHCSAQDTISFSSQIIASDTVTNVCHKPQLITIYGKNASQSSFQWQYYDNQQTN